MQNLNLYQVERQRHSGPQKAQMLAGLAVLALLCLLHAVWQGWQLRQGAARLAQAESAAQEQETRLAAVKSSFVEPQLDGRLPTELAEREAGNQELQRLIGYLQLLGSQQSTGFVAPLQALAQYHPQSGLWLSAISLRAGGTEVRLQGSSQDQELLPQYLQRLGQSPVFKGREFARFDVRRGEDQLLRFDLSSRADDGEKVHE
ncbi:PilN domain-containing protein [Pseudomonas sp. 2FG]|uniref:PilN domain-containing protein n=1 Tax=Pseudomonas sp. 2FG TaxID=2502191 RepID=UPI0010F8069C|nr:PilN domain-containing protein [Pseudomonas sp. 2FG]